MGIKRSEQSPTVMRQWGKKNKKQDDGRKVEETPAVRWLALDVFVKKQEWKCKKKIREGGVCPT